MTNNAASILDQPSLVIAIDCWKEVIPGFNFDHWESDMASISKFCQTSKYVKSIALSTFFDDNTISLDQPWVNQSCDFFYNETKWDLLRKLWEETKFTEQSITHPILADYSLREDQVGFTLSSGLQTLYYCNYINPSIKNIYVCGFVWDVCVKYRPTGWLELVGMNNSNMFKNQVNILTKKSCCGHQNDFFPDNNIWIQLDQDTFLLNSQSEFIYKNIMSCAEGCALSNQPIV